ncbi:probable phosphorylase b kinase regulatory subunit alpha isoform X1 [Tigriopus californicus]|uniref:probable phosphorylase b kinase regulatory subunit alpha isoform X1 n=1 Tax=Tigriopus californicus TaxID=6832 RepID=UPI0027DA4244|nr:probable phosphorylase b kinase regulatory subunit alpha isoform X1 [Tigriopus californicus]
MRSRSNSAVRFDIFNRIVHKTILRYQNPVTGLLPASEHNDHAWIRDNVYSILAVWSLASAYKKAADLDEDRSKTHELEQATVKCMRGLLTCMMRQSDRVERFKETFSPKDSIHAKFSSETGLPVVGDDDWGHFQVDSISLYLLILAQMTASGMQIIFSLDEVAFVQNLVFFIEAAYCTPDYGIWERGDKTNMGIVELNSSSIGMAKAALEAVNELDLFGARGGSASVIHVMADETQKCHAVLESMLPRESLSKETDAALLTVIGFPAFAVETPELIKKTCDEVINNLGGKYGCRSFLRDGYKNPRENSTKLHYEPWELRLFENTECQWPLFFCYMVVNSCFVGDRETALQYSEALDDVMVKSGDGIKWVPELYSVSLEDTPKEELEPGSQARIPMGRVPFMWAQSLYVIGRLIMENFIAVGELDPINRRLSTLKRPDVVVQVVVLAKDRKIKDLLATHEIEVKTLSEVSPIEVHPARVLSHLYTFLGKNEKLGLTGRKNRDVGILSTSKLYKIGERVFAFTPQRFDVSRNYMDCDISLMMTTLEYGLNNLSTCWKASGRPLITLILGESMLDNGKVHPAMLSSLKKLQNGYINGARVTFGTFEQFLSTSCITNLSFLGAVEEGQPDRLLPSVEKYLTDQMGKSAASLFSLLKTKGHSSQGVAMKRLSVRGSVRRSRSLKLGGESPEGLEMAQLIKQESTEELQTRDIDLVARSKIMSESQYGQLGLQEVVEMLAQSQTLDEQGDIMHYLVYCYGLDQKIKVQRTGEDVCVRDLLRTLYEAACSKKHWGLVRHCAGFLGKKVEDLSKSVTDLLVRQKQVTVGMPPNSETKISGGKLTSTELRQIIHEAYDGDESMAMLSQELLVYLAMFIQTEPQLFHGMLRLRIGLIIQVMAMELARSLKMKTEDASEELINISPFEMRRLLHHIMSGREFGIHKLESGYSIVCDHATVSKNRKGAIRKWRQLRNVTKYIQKVRKSSRDCLPPPKHEVTPEVKRKALSVSAIPVPSTIMEKKESQDGSDEDSDDDIERQGSWMRRRCLDGALNRVPRGFYEKIWKVLLKCNVLSIQGNTLDTCLTQEMTRGEMKFALRVEGALNTIPEPEYRQLMVEALMVLSLAAEYEVVAHFGQIVKVENIVSMANKFFLIDQFNAKGDATLCCATDHEGNGGNRGQPLVCQGAAGICRHFYDSAPSGTYGTMTYLVRACSSVIETLPKEGHIDCSIA